MLIHAEAYLRYKSKWFDFFILFFIISACLVPVWIVSADQEETQLNTYFQKVIGLTPAEIQSIASGEAIVKILNTGSKNDVVVFGAIYVNAPVENFVSLYQDLSQLRDSPGIIAINRFSNPPQISDLAQFKLSDEDIKNLSNCKLDDCEVQLPATAIDALRQDINWNEPDAAEKVNNLFRQGILDGLKQYQIGGNEALGDYRDKKRPFVVAQEFQILLNSSGGLPNYLPEFHSYLLNYPKVALEGSQTYFYWETVKFGLKPTSRVDQVVIYKNPASGIYAFGDKQLYATHYFQTAIDLTFCVKDPAHPEMTGFYLITRKGSTQAGLTGVKGSIVRKVAVDKTQSSLKQGLTLFKQKLETASK